MSWNNIIPVWVIKGERIVEDYKKGILHYVDAKEQMEELGCPPSMIGRLDKEKSSADNRGRYGNITDP